MKVVACLLPAVGIAARSTTDAKVGVGAIIAQKDAGAMKKYLATLNGIYITDDFLDFMRRTNVDLQVNVLDVLSTHQQVEQKELDAKASTVQVDEKYVKDVKGSADNADSNWVSCVAAEKDAAVEVEQSLVEQAVRKGTRDTLCAARDALPNAVASMSVPTFTCTIPNCDRPLRLYQRDLEAEESRVAKEVGIAQDEYDVANTKCLDAGAAYDKQTEVVKDQIEIWEQKKVQCETLRGNDMVAQCRYAHGVQDMCEASDDLTTYSATALQNENGREADWDRTRRVQCIIQDFIDGKDLDVEACKVDTIGDALNTHSEVHTPYVQTGCTMTEVTFSGVSWDVPPVANSSEYVKIEPYSVAVSHPKGTSPLAFCTEEASPRYVAAGQHNLVEFQQTWFRIGAEPWHDRRYAVDTAPTEMYEGVMVQTPAIIDGGVFSVRAPVGGNAYVCWDLEYDAGVSQQLDAWELVSYIQWSGYRWGFIKQSGKVKVVKKAVKEEEDISLQLQGDFSGFIVIVPTTY